MLWKYNKNEKKNSNDKNNDANQTDETIALGNNITFMFQQFQRKEYVDMTIAQLEWINSECEKAQVKDKDKMIKTTEEKGKKKLNKISVCWVLKQSFIVELIYHHIVREGENLILKCWSVDLQSCLSIG